MKKQICVILAVMLLCVCGCSSGSEESVQNGVETPIAYFFDGLNQNDYALYKKCTPAEVIAHIGAYDFEAQFLDYRKSMQGERVIYEIMEKRALSAEEQETLKTYCDKRGITSEDSCKVRLRSTLTDLPGACVCVQTGGAWYILAW